MSSSYHEQLYGYSFHNETNPLPPPMSPTTSALTMAAVIVYMFGSLVSVVLLVCIASLTTASNRALRRIQYMMCLSDMLLYLVFTVSVSINLHNQKVLTNALCQAQGVAVHFSSTANFTTITFSVYDRYSRLRRLRDHTSKTTFSLLHWRLFEFFVLPLLLLHALLPVLTSNAYGIYVPKPYNVTATRNQVLV